MAKGLAIYPEKCTGCQRCVLACSYNHTGRFSVSRSRIKVVKPSNVSNVPIVCIQCGLCIPSCPFGALARDPKTQAVLVDEEKCVGCGFCVNSCPYGTIYLDPISSKAIKCDLCGGDPACVKACPFEAILYEDVNSVAKRKRRVLAMAVNPEIPGSLRRWK